MNYQVQRQHQFNSLMSKKNIQDKLRNLIDHIPYQDQEISINDQYILELLAVLIKIFNSGLEMLQIQSPQHQEVPS